MSRIFLSHSAKENFEAIALRDWLASEGWNDVFLDLDPERGIAAGERWERALHAAANRCEAVIFLVSENWLASGWCLKEYALARGLNKKLFAALIDSMKTIGSLPEELTGVWQIVDLVHGQDLRLFPTRSPGSYEERHIGYSVAGLLGLKRGLDKAGLDARFFAWPPESEPDRAPYRGLKPLEAADAGIFFGRDAPIVEAIDKLRGLRAGAPPRLLAMLGASGAGKSSFLRAGLLPRLKRDDAQFIPLPAVRPERAALTGETGFANALAAILPAHTRAELRAAAQAGAGALRPLLAECVQTAMAQRVAGDETERPPDFVVAIDQAEELFRAEGREQSAALLALLADLAKGDDPAVIVIFAIRSDSYDALQNAKAVEGLRQEAFPLLPMPRGAYQEVVEGPARRAEEAGGKLTIEPALTQRLLVDIEAGAGDALPLLAFALEQLYLDYRQTGALRLTDYEKSGGLKGAIDAAVERALARADADPRIPRDREARLALLHRGLIPWLAGIDPDSKTPRRNIARRSDIPAEAAPLIDNLIEERLLSADTRVTRDPRTRDETRESTIEPTHEALLRQWGLLDGWLKEDFGLLATLEGVKRASRDWDAHARGDSWLAHLGERLAEAQALDARPDIAARLDAADRAYLTGCRSRQEAARAQAEQRRREREETLARAVRNESVALTSLANIEAEKRPVKAAKLALAAWPRDNDDKTTPKLSETLDALGQIVPNLHQRRLIRNAYFAAFSPDGSQIVTAPRDNTARVWDAATGKAIAVLSGHESWVDSAAFGPDGSRIVTASRDNTARVWDAATGEAIAVLSGHEECVTSAAFSADGSRIVTASFDRTARIWEAATGNAVATLSGHKGPVRSAAFSPDRSRIVTASVDKTARVWDAATGKAIAVLSGHKDEMWSAAFSPDGSRIVTSSVDKTARIWDAATSTRPLRLTFPLRRYQGGLRVLTAILDKVFDNTPRAWDAAIGNAIAVLRGHKRSVLSAAFSPDGSRIVTVSEDKTARVWDAATGRAIAVLSGHKDEVWSAAFSPDGSRIVTASWNGTARVWDAATGKEIAVLIGPQDRLESAAFSPNGLQIVTVPLDGTARIWCAATGIAIAVLSGHRAPVNSAAFSPDGLRIVTGSEDGTAFVWNTATRKASAVLSGGHAGMVNSAAFSPEGSRIVTASWDRTARVWDAATGKAIAVLGSHKGPVWSAAFSPEGSRIVTASWDGTARVWDAATGKAIAVLGGHEGPVWPAIFSPDGSRIVTGSSDRTARVWDAATGRAIAVLSGHEDRVISAAFSPDGSRIVTASSDRTARVWDAATGRPIAILSGHEDAARSAAFSPDGSRVVTASHDKTARVWDAATGRAIAVLSGHEDAARSAAFSPDGSRIVTASHDKTARVWDAATGKAIVVLRGHKGPVDSATFSPDGSRIVTASNDMTARVWDVSAIPKGNILQVACALLRLHEDPVSLDGVTDYPLTFDRPICVTDPPPPDLMEPAASQSR
jgi:WD40 repeat protein